jgi:hypothetical protein
LQEVAGENQAERQGKSGQSLPSCQDNTGCSHDGDGGDGGQVISRNDVSRSRPVNNVESNTIHQSESAQKVLKCFYTNSDSVLNKKSELLTVIANECIGFICITGTRTKNHGGKIVPLKF